MKITISSLLILFALHSPELPAQDRFIQKPQIGKVIEDYTFTHVENMKAKKVSLKDYRGKWLFLDFWYAGCNDNVKSLPDIQKYKEALGDKMEVLLVVLNARNDRNIHQSFRKVQQKMKTHLAVAYDSVLAPRWDIWAMPYFIIVDPDGVVRAITYGWDLTVEKLENLINGGKPDIQMVSEESNRYKYLNYESPHDSAMLYRSVLTTWNRERFIGVALDYYMKDPSNYPEGLVEVGVSLAVLYQAAYTDGYDWTVKRTDGELLYPHALIETADRKLFVYDSTHATVEGHYNYNLMVHPSKRNDRKFIRLAMQNELKNIFGFDVVIEKRSMPVWRLLSKPGEAEKLQSKGGEKSITSSPMQIKLRNASMDDFRSMIIHNLTTRGVVFINENETGYFGNVDVELNALKTDLNEVQKALTKIGFYLKRENVLMNVVVIKDAGQL